MQVAVDAEHHLVVAHEVTNQGHDRHQLANMAQQAKAATGAQNLRVLADRGYFSGEEILACEQAGVTPYMPRPLTSGAKADGRFAKEDFVYLHEENAYRCPGGYKLPWHMTTVEHGLTLHRYWDLASCLRAQAPVHDEPQPSDHPLGARGGHRGHAAPARP